MLFSRRSSSRSRQALFWSKDHVAACTIVHQRGVAPRLTQLATLDPHSPEPVPESFQQVLPRTRGPLSLVLADDQYQLLLVEAPRVEPTELRAAIRWRVKDLIDFHIDDAVIDVFEIPGQERRPPGQAMMYAVAARARDIRTHIDRIESAHYKLDVIDISEMAMRNLASLTEEDVQGVCLLHLQEDHGLVTLTQQAHLFLSRRLEVGLRSLEQDPLGASELIVLEVQRSLDYYDSHFQQAPIAGLKVLPGPAGMDALTSALNANLNLSAEPYPLDSVLQLETEAETTVLANSMLAIGGALRREELNL